MMGNIESLNNKSKLNDIEKDHSKYFHYIEEVIDDLKKNIEERFKKLDNFSIVINNMEDKDYIQMIIKSRKELKINFFKNGYPILDNIEAIVAGQFENKNITTHIGQSELRRPFFIYLKDFNWYLTYSYKKDDFGDVENIKEEVLNKKEDVGNLKYVLDNCRLLRDDYKLNNDNFVSLYDIFEKYLV